jgi:hypothetical protein
LRREGEAQHDFDWAVVPCATREEAAAEADRRQAAEEGDAVWIYLRHGGQWVAKRTPHDPMSARDPVTPKRSVSERVIDTIADAASDPGTFLQ